MKCFILSLMFLLSISCTSTNTQESTGQYLDSSAITAKVKAKLLDDPATHVLKIKVKTYKGEVQLSGFVNSTKEKERAGELAGSVPQVKSVHNNLIVK